jgi:hypothetical protein
MAVDPANSLRALLDRGLREQVITANVNDAALATLHIRGEGHAFWVDMEGGYSADQQQSLIDWLLALTHDPAASPPKPQTVRRELPSDVHPGEETATAPATEAPATTKPAAAPPR